MKDSIKIHSPRSVQPAWCQQLPLQQQSVLLLAARGADGIPKQHDSKIVHAAYRGTILCAGRYGRPLRWGEKGDSFMTLDVIASGAGWEEAIKLYDRACDGLPLHYVTHFMHGAQIISFKHPQSHFRIAWAKVYETLVDHFHLRPESESEMDARLGDWGQVDWSSNEDPVLEASRRL